MSAGITHEGHARGHARGHASQRRGHITPDTVLVALRGHVGRENGIHARDLARRLCGPLTVAADERLLRAVITDLRLAGHHLCGTPESGYYLAATPDELNETCKFLVDRAMASLSQVSRMKAIALPDLHGQMHLPT
jgi:hypothetical protein